MCDDHSECSPYDRIQSVGNVEEPQRNDPCNFRRNRISCADRSEGNRTMCEELEETDYNRKTRVWRCI